MPRIAALVVAASLLLAPPALAANRKVISRAKDIDLVALAQLAKHGEVALIENAPDGRARQVVLFSVFDAPREKVFDVLMDVEAYPKFLRTVVETRITERGRGGLITFDWELDLPFFNLSGSRQQRGRRPSLVQTRGFSGNLRGTRERWELYAIDGGKRTLAAFYRALDVETGGLLIEAMVKFEPSMEQGANLSTCFVHIRGLRAHLEGREPQTIVAKTGPVPPFRRLELGVDALKPLKGLLAHGQLALIESHPDGSLAQAAILGVVAASKADLARIVQDPAKYPDFMPNFAEQTVKKRPDGKLAMTWELDVPLKNLEGTSLMTIEEDGSVDVVATSGDIARGRWRWEFLPFGPSKTLGVHYAYSDVRESSWVTKKVVEKEPLFEHGIVLASQTVALTAMKARAEGHR